MQPETHGPSTRGPTLRSRARQQVRSFRTRRQKRREQQAQRLATEPGVARKERTAPKRGWRWIIIAVLVMAIYPVVGTLILSTGLFEKLTASEDLRIELDKPAWTLWPGHVHVAGARIFVNGTTQFKLAGKHLLLHVNLFPLVKKRLRVTTIQADDVHYWMRVQVKDTKGIEKRLAAYPRLDDLPGNPTLIEEQAEKTEKRQGDFTVDVEGIDVRVAELWFMEYHYIGPGTLKGGFLVGPRRMRVNTSVQNLGPGELRFGAEHVIAKQFRGQIKATVPDLNPEDHADESFLELVTADIDLKGDVQTLSHVSAYTGKIRVIDGAGAFETRLFLQNGNLGDQSRFWFSTPKVGIRGKGFGVDTDWVFDAHVEKSEHASAKQRTDASVLPRLRSTSRITYVSLANLAGDIFTIQLHNDEQDVVLKGTQLGRMTDIDHASIRFPRIVTTDLHDLAAITGEGGTIESKGGEARASLAFDVDAHHVARGKFGAEFTGLQLKAAGMQFSGDGDARCLMDVDLNRKDMTLKDVFVRLMNVGMRAGDEKVSDWWARISVPHFVAAGMPPKTLEGGIIVLAKNAEPLLKGLAAKDKISDIIPKLTKLSDLRIRASMRRQSGATDVLLEPVQNELFDVAGRYYSKGEQSRLAMVIGGKAVSLGIAKDDSGTTLEPFARQDWLNAQLQRFPTPDKIHSSQP